MMPEILAIVHYGLLLAFGITLSLAFAGIAFNRKGILTALVLFVTCGMLQLVLLYFLGEALVWKLYPAITHAPIILVLCLYMKNRFSTTLAAVTTAYLCCQPAKWLGLFFTSITDNPAVGRFIQIAALIVVGIVMIHYIASYIAEIYNKDTRTVFIFCNIPLVYYIFDYVMGVYSDLWISNNQVVTEFVPFFLCFSFMVFCVTYYKEYEQKADAERKEHIIRLTVEQQEKEVEAIRKSYLETRLLRHDMRHLLNSLTVSIKNDDKEASLRMIAGHVAHIDATIVNRYCSNDTVNYVLAGFSSKCEESGTAFNVSVETDFFSSDETMVASIISNSLENALNAQKELPSAKRQINILIQDFDNKLLISVTNPFKTRPVFVDGMPVSSRKGHGYGTKSISYLSERLGGKCQFSVQDEMFVTRVII